MEKDGQLPVKQFLNEFLQDGNIFFDKYAGPVAFISYEDGKVRIEKTNEHYVQEVGMNFSIDEVVGVNPVAYLEEQYAQNYMKMLRDAIDSNEEQNCETWIKVESKCCGEDQICLRRTVRLIDKTGNRYLFYMTVRNITPEKEKYDKVADSELRFRFAAEQANMYAWEYTVATKEMRPCHRCMRDLGLPALLQNYPEPAIEMGIFPPDYADLYRDWHRQIEAGAESLEAIIPLTVDRVPFHVRYTTEFDEQGKPYKAYGSAMLVIEDKEKEIEYQEIVNTLSKNYVDVFRLNLKSGTGRTLKLEGYSSDILIAAKETEQIYSDEMKNYVLKRVHPEDSSYMAEAMDMNVVRQKLSQNEDYSGTYRIIEDGTVHYMQFRIFHLEDKDTVILAFQNVDEMIEKQKRTEETLEKALNEAKRANAAKTTYLSHISHDIRTPLNGIIGLLEMDERHSEDREMMEGNRKKIKIAANHLLSLINDVLSLSKIEDDNVVLAHDAFDLQDMIEDVMTIAGMRADDAGITLHFDKDLQEIRHPWVYGSPLHVRQIFLNLLGNAIKYNKPNGSVTFQSKFMGIDSSKVGYQFIIADTGLGMSEDFVKRIYEPFSQEHYDEKSVYHGTGLGMSIVKALIDKMGGKIDIQSKEGIGSTFTITLWFEQAENATIENSKNEKEATDINGYRIMIVEDNKVNMYIGKRLLEDAGAIVTPVYNGQDALKLFEEKEPGTFDVILMDVMMPVMDGLSATRAIRSLEREDAGKIPIIAMTANAFEEDKKEAMDAGMTGYITKPMDAKTVLQVISTQYSGYDVSKEEEI